MTSDQQANYEIILKEVAAKKATLVAVSKTHPVTEIEAYYALGQRDFGENRVAELSEKQSVMPGDVNWHFIGHLQRNKVKEIVSYVHLIHGIDSERLLKEVDKQAIKVGRQVDVLLQFHIAEEDSKYGLTSEVAMQILNDTPPSSLKGARIVGVMGMATYTDNDEQIADEFDQLKSIFDELKANYFSKADHFKEISMGMSGDYPIALEHGSTMVRVGSLLFGQRSYN